MVNNEDMMQGEEQNTNNLFRLNFYREQMLEVEGEFLLDVEGDGIKRE